jgi:hypothetical protein
MPSRRSPTLPSSARRAAPPPSPCFPLCKGFCSRTTRLGADMTLRRRAGGRRLRRSWRHGSPRMSISRPHRHRAPRRRRRPRLLLQSVRRRQACAVHHDDQLFAHHAIRCEIGGPHREGLRCRMHFGFFSAQFFGVRTDGLRARAARVCFTAWHSRERKQPSRCTFPRRKGPLEPWHHTRAVAFQNARSTLPAHLPPVCISWLLTASGLAGEWRGSATAGSCGPRLCA